tara:strand:+ start:1644 stop:2456 length:813 start_codon:yes stop_codon:yes gene_type:complete
MTKSAEMCSMTRQEFRTRVEGYKELGLMTVQTSKVLSKSGSQKINVSKMILNLDHDLFRQDGVEREVSHTTTGYPPEFEEDWLIYIGIDGTKVGEKKSAYVSWGKSVRKYGRGPVMLGTVNYVSKCEAMDTFKKHGATWWNPKEARFSLPEYQDNKSTEIALWHLLNSPVLGNLTEGGVCIKITGDPLMGEALLRLKGTDRVLGQTLDRMGDRKFREAFMNAYKLARNTKEPRSVIYSQYENQIEWSIDDGPQTSRGGGRRETSTVSSNL